MAQIPEIITRYLRAEEANDIDGLVACFVEDGTVVDEGKTYLGPAAIREWSDSLAAKYTHTVTVTGATHVAGGEYEVTTHLEGDFPGGEVDLTYVFRLRDELIGSVRIG
jgi:ketosteroid isomerase-like protein